MKPRLVLGSSSQSRIIMLARIGYQPDIIQHPEIDERVLKGELPKNTALRLAREKATKVHQDFPNDIVIGADTICAVGRFALPKALTKDDIRLCLKKTSGRRHKVFTGICGMINDRVIIKLGTTTIQFKVLTKQECDEFIEDMPQWYGKAGGYTLMGKAAAFVTMMSGDEASNVIGLPLYHANNIIKTLSNNKL